MSELDHYDYHLPHDLIAQDPLPSRADARMLVVDRHRRALTHRAVRDLPRYLRPEDGLVLNDTKVLPARLIGHRAGSGGRWEGLYLQEDEHGVAELMTKTRGRLAPGEAITLTDLDGRPAASLRMISKTPSGTWTALPEPVEAWSTLLGRLGRVPLPPYIRGGDMIDTDRDRYQTVYARTPGAIAAPTAGLHLTPELLQQIETGGTTIARLTLHVGAGTFKPVTADRLADHAMHSERACLTDDTARRLDDVRASSGRIVAVGTTSVRLLESAADDEGKLRPFDGATDLFIRPPYRFKAVDAMLTNFHLPRSTLLVLVRTFGGDDLIREAYEEAVRERYRFYSYGDAMLIL